ncbi:RNA polymerase sigma-70 factor [Chitinophaga sp. 212800010-3]|uniref:RNA polymerase sigma-70 factor n=1 Tax=unclassified Chitinophaga TaxID=2619133 RepID=UPI002DE462B6|nr:RNA polymerase sigma-70 factor, ECF subfamily [Chitinophaga sp. 212800010-3]
MERARHTDQLAVFEKLFHVYHDKLHRYAFTILKDSEAASDIVQLVFKKLWEKRNDVVMEEAIAGYLYKTTYSLCLNDIRNNKIRQQHSRLATIHTTKTDDNARDKVIAGELTRRIQEVLDDLPPQCRAVFIKSRMDGKKYAEIAKDLDISVKTVEAQISKALKIFKARLSDYLVFVLIIIYIRL